MSKEEQENKQEVTEETINPEDVEKDFEELEKEVKESDDTEKVIENIKELEKSQRTEEFRSFVTQIEKAEPETQKKSLSISLLKVLGKGLGWLGYGGVHASYAVMKLGYWTVCLPYATFGRMSLLDEKWSELMSGVKDEVSSQVNSWRGKPPIAVNIDRRLWKSDPERARAIQAQNATNLDKWEKDLQDYHKVYWSLDHPLFKRMRRFLKGE